MTNTAITKLANELTNLTKVLNQFSVIHSYNEATIIYPDKYTKEVLENGFEKLNVDTESFSITKKYSYYNSQYAELLKELEALDKATLELRQRSWWIRDQLKAAKDESDD